MEKKKEMRMVVTFFAKFMFVGMLLLFNYYWLGNGIVNIRAEQVFSSGICGENMTWTLYVDGTLEISGDGEMGSYGPYKNADTGELLWEDAPWIDLVDRIKVIKLPDMITRINSFTFDKCDDVSIIIPKNVKVISKSAFGNNPTIYGYEGSYAEKYAKQYNITFKDIKLFTDTRNNIFVVEEDGNQYWYENGVKQGVKKNADGTIDTTYRGKEIYDEATDGWYWLDNVDGGKKAVSKDVYQDSFAGNWGDIINEDGSRNGKWVRYDSQGKMVKGWCQGSGADAKVIENPASATDGQPVYYFDQIYGTMAKGYATVDGVEYYFNPFTGVLERIVTDNLAGFTGWKDVDGVLFWYEEGNRQGTSANTSYRGKEIFDPGTNAWYWLDNVDAGKKAVSKDVYQESLAGDWGDIVKEDGQKYGKWVRYDAEGHMIKGWSTNENGTYYFDLVYGTMAKGLAVIDGEEHFFNQGTGVMEW